MPVSRAFTLMICLCSENSLILKTFFSNHLVFLDKHQMLRGSFSDVFRGYSQRADSGRRLSKHDGDGSENVI